MKSGYMKRAMESADPRFADLLRRLGHEDDEPTKAKAAEGDKPAKPKRKTNRTYKRRDMKAKED